MAKGRTCPQCGNIMYAQEEKYYPAGTEVVYLCTNVKCLGFKIKVFEDK
jgi:hypothetical protein